MKRMLFFFIWLYCNDVCGMLKNASDNEIVSRYGCEGFLAKNKELSKRENKPISNKIDISWNDLPEKTQNDLAKKGINSVAFNQYLSVDLCIASRDRKNIFEMHIQKQKPFSDSFCVEENILSKEKPSKEMLTEFTWEDIFKLYADDKDDLDSFKEDIYQILKNGTFFHFNFSIDRDEIKGKKLYKIRNIARKNRENLRRKAEKKSHDVRKTNASLENQIIKERRIKLPEVQRFLVDNMDHKDFNKRFLEKCNTYDQKQLVELQKNLKKRNEEINPKKDPNSYLNIYKNMYQRASSLITRSRVFKIYKKTNSFADDYFKHTKLDHEEFCYKHINDVSLLLINNDDLVQGNRLGLRGL